MPSGRRVRLGNAAKLFGNQRETVDDAVAGDVVGLVGNDLFGIGDTLTDDRTIVYHEIPEFTPECFAYLHNPQPANFKKFRLGLEQLLKEGVARRFFPVGGNQNTPLLAAVGPLQFEVFQHRLENEYNAPCRVEMMPWTITRWWRRPGEPAVNPAEYEPSSLPDCPDGARLVFDDHGRTAVLFVDQWPERFFRDRHPKVELSPVPFSQAAPTNASKGA
jgi:peptide chain release factor 3